MNLRKFFEIIKNMARKNLTISELGKIVRPEPVGDSSSRVEDIVNMVVSQQMTNMTTPMRVQANWIQSQNFQTGVAGWNIDALGNCEFNNGLFRGNVTVSRLNFSKFTMQSNYESISAFTTAGSFTPTATLGRLSMVAVSGVSAAYILVDALNTYPLKTKNPSFETEIRTDSPLTTDQVVLGCVMVSFVNYGPYGLNGSDYGFGFRISNNKVYAWFDGVSTLISGIDTTYYLSHIYAGEYISTGTDQGTVNLYVDGTLVYTKTAFNYRDVLDGQAVTFGIHLQSTAGASGSGALSSRLTYQQNL